MKTMHTEDFIEFKVLPYIISFFALLFIATGITRKRKMLYTLFTLFVIFGIIAMVDFWKWEYDYGHNLDPGAAIIVPGMAYQPPLIGFKQLLNFGAYSIPDIGGWLFIVAGVLALLSIVLDRRMVKKESKLKVVAALILVSSTLSACSVTPQPLKIGVDNCTFCQMTISNPRFGAEILTAKGKVLKYDDISCLVTDMTTKKIAENDIHSIYSADFCGNHDLIDVKSSFFFKSENLRSPMAGNIAAFSNKDSMNFYMNSLSGEAVAWDDIIK